MYRITLALIVVALSFLACSAPQKEVVIDNPTNQPVAVTFADGVKVSVKPFDKVLHSITFGKQEITIDGGESITVELDPEQDYLINPTQSTYYIEKVPYFISEAGREAYMEMYGSMSSEVEGVELNGKFEKMDNAVVIPKIWSFGLDEPVARAGMGTDSRRGFVEHSKLHRRKDLLFKVRDELGIDLIQNRQ